MQGKNTSSDSIKAILDKISASSGTSSSSAARSGGSSNASRTSATPQSAASTPSAAPAPQPAATTQTQQQPTQTPGTYHSTSRYYQPREGQTTPRITTTYVPKFTGASLNYRMVNDPRRKVAALDPNGERAGEQTQAPATAQQGYAAYPQQQTPATAQQGYAAYPQQQAPATAQQGYAAYPQQQAPATAQQGYAAYPQQQAPATTQQGYAAYPQQQAPAAAQQGYAAYPQQQAPATTQQGYAAYPQQQTPAPSAQQGYAAYPQQPPVQVQPTPTPQPVRVTPTPAPVRVTPATTPPPPTATPAQLDPTAESSGGRATQKINIRFGKPVKEDAPESASTVFKFDAPAVNDSEPEPKPEPTPQVQPIEHTAAPTPDPEPIDEPVPEVAEPENKKREYKIPDPTDIPVDLPSDTSDNTVSSALAVKSVLEDAPDATADGETVSKKANEYTSFAQRDSFKDRFIDTIMSVYVRFFAALLLSILVGVAETMFLSGVNIPKILHLTAIPGSMALIDLLFVLCLYMLTLPETILAIGCVLRGKVIPELFLTVSFGVMVAYTMVITLFSPKNYALYGLLFAILALVSIASSYFKTSADFTSFKRVTKNGEKTVIDNAYTRTLERENAALDGVVMEHKSRTARTFKTLFMSDFFGRTSVCAENSFNILIMLGVSLGMSVVVGAIALFIPGGWVNAVTAFALVFMMSCPAMSIMMHKVPYFYASKEAELENSAIIGEKSLYLYSGVDVVTFDDTEIFGEEDVTLQRIMLYGRSDNLSKALSQMSAIFMNVGGPLNILFSDSLDKQCAPAQSVTVEENGISGVVDGNTVLAGTLEYMMNKGARIPAEEAAQENLANSTKVMFAAENGVVYAKFYIRYSFSEEFTMLMPTLEDSKIKPLVYTRDPNITNGLISALTAGADKIRVMKKYDTLSAEVIYRKASAGMMTNGDKSNVINMILLSKKYVDLQSYFGLTEVISVAVGCLLATVLSILGLSILPSIALAVFQIAWCAMIHFISAMSFRFLKPKKK